MHILHKTYDLVLQPSHAHSAVSICNASGNLRRTVMPPTAVVCLYVPRNEMTSKFYTYRNHCIRCYLAGQERKINDSPRKQGESPHHTGPWSENLSTHFSTIDPASGPTFKASTSLPSPHPAHLPCSPPHQSHPAQPPHSHRRHHTRG